MQAQLAGEWLNLGVDSHMATLPEALRPGIGLRPGADRPDVKALVPRLYAAHYASVAASAKQGFHVVVDVGHHDGAILRDCLRLLSGLNVMLVGVRCQLEQILARRALDEDGRHVAPGAPVPEPVLLWQRQVHDPGIYDLEVDTSLLSPEECTARIREMLDGGLPRPTAVERLLA
jgi:chloramphenicol 3-O phosphotransferase